MTQNWLREFPYHSLDTYQNSRCLIANQISRHAWLKIYLRSPISSQAHNSSSKIVELKRSSMHKCTTFSPSRTAISRLFYYLHGLALHAFILHCRTKWLRSDILNHRRLYEFGF